MSGKSISNLIGGQRRCWGAEDDSNTNKSKQIMQIIQAHSLREIIFDWQKVLNIVSKKKYFQGYRKLLVDNFIKSIATFRTQWDRSIIILLLQNGEWDCRRRDSDRVKCCCWPPSGKLKCQNQWLLCNNDSITYTSAWNALSIHRSVQSSADGLSHVGVIYYDMRFCWPIFLYACTFVYGIGKYQVRFITVFQFFGLKWIH